MFTSLSALKTNKAKDKPAVDKLCFVCEAVRTEYCPVPCRCFESCKKCAMKMATGGKCKVCKQYFTNMSLCRNKVTTLVEPPPIKDASDGVSINEIDFCLR